MAEDKELAKLLLERQEVCKQLEIELADRNRTLKMAQMHMKEWQDKYASLQKTLKFPKISGFQVVNPGPPLKKLTGVLPLLDAVNRLISSGGMLVPVFEENIDNQSKPFRADDSDEGCEPVG